MTADAHRGMIPRMLRKALAWSVAVPLAVLGSQLAHALAYRLAVPDSEQRAVLLAETGHGYLAYWPIAVAVGTIVVLVAFATDVAGRLSGGEGTCLRPLHLAVVAPSVFACQELLERAVETRSLPLEALGERTFVLGLALQLPFALLTYLAARLLLKAAAAIAIRLRPRPASRLSSSLPWRPSPAAVGPVAHALALGFGTRGPPAPR